MTHASLIDNSNTNFRGYIFNLNSAFLPELKQGDILQLRREDYNTSDPDLVSAYLKDELVGPADSNLSKALVPILGQGLTVNAEVMEVNDQNISVGIQIQDQANHKPAPNLDSVTQGRPSNPEASYYQQEDAVTLTDEQKEILSCEVSGDEIIKINAFAGTGKTTTLLEYTRKHSQLQFLYVAFSKSVRLEAEERFPGNVDCRTSHSLAYQSVGFQYQPIQKSMKINVVMTALNLRDYQEALDIRKSLSNFLTSSDEKIARKHLPRYLSHDYQDVQFFIRQTLKLWRLMCDENNSDVGMLHDGYLKLYQLSKPKLEYDVILLDEAQDTNPAVAEIILSQSCPKILVGDRHQQIYSFRGARNAMENISGSRTFYLTNSFRFGDQIARIANKVIKVLKNERYQLKGVGEASTGSGPQVKAYIARTNAGLFDEAVHLMAIYKIAFLGGIDGYRLDEILDIHHLYSKRTYAVKSDYIKSFGTYPALLNFAQEANDRELKSICRIVEKYRHQIPKLINGIKGASVAKEDAEVILTTAHKSKGSQFSNVRLIGDFPDMYKNGKMIAADEFEPDEINLIYVAVTRAKRNLDLSRYPDLVRFLTMEHEIKDHKVTSLDNHRQLESISSSSEADSLNDNPDQPESTAELNSSEISKEEQETMEEILQDVINHLEYLGYKIDNHEDTIRAIHPSKAILVLFNLNGGLLLGSGLPISIDTVQNNGKFFFDLNEIHSRLLVSRCYLGEDGDSLMCLAYYPGPYDKVVFGRFIEMFAKDTEGTLVEFIESISSDDSL